MDYVVEIVSIEELHNFVTFIKNFIQKKDIVCIEGELGAGKTTFVKSFLKLFDYEGVSSPTFSIINEYQLGDFKIIHADFYRIENVGEFVDYIKQEQEQAISFIEWPKDIDCTKKLTITPISQTKRVYKLCL